MVGLPYFYDSQLRTIFSHFVRTFSGFKIKTGRDSNGFESFITVPAIWGDQDRQALSVINQNSENTALSVPRIACYVQSMSMAPERRGYGGNEEDLLVTKRAFDRENGTYTSEKGHSYHVKRLYPNPLDIVMNVDIITSNMEQKCQLFEQIYLVFNPVFEMQITSNPLHYTPIKRIMMESLDWDLQGVPHGADDELEILRISFKIEADLSPPARVKRQTLINTIIKEIGMGNSEDDILGWGPDDYALSVETPGMHHAVLETNNKLILHGANNVSLDTEGNNFIWSQLIDEYGELKSGTSKINLRWVDDINDDSQDVTGYITYSNDDNILNFTIDSDTLPVATISYITGIVDPHVDIPGETMGPAIGGYRFLLTDEIGSEEGQPWGELIAYKNDIIEFNGTNWFVSYDASESTTIDFANDLSSGTKLMFKDGEWINIINKSYAPGFWRLLL